MGFVCGRLYKHNNNVFCCVGSEVDSMYRALMRSDAGVTASPLECEGWQDVTSIFRGCDRGSSILYSKCNGWTDAGIILERCYVSEAPHLVLRGWKGQEVLVTLNQPRPAALGTPVEQMDCNRGVPLPVDRHSDL